MATSGYTALTIGRGIRTAGSVAPQKVALADVAGKSRTYAELIARMDAVGRLSVSHRLGKGDVVALIAPNCIEYPEIVAGLSERGIVVATLNPMLARSELGRIFVDCKPRMVIAAEGTELPDTRFPVLRIGAQLDAALDTTIDKASSPPIDESETFAIAYTSGTTGAPKGVLLSHRSRCLMFLAMAGEYGCFGRDDHFLAMAPMCHGAGLAFALAPIYQGGTCTLLYSAQPENILAALDEIRPTGVFVVPTHLHRIFKAPEPLRARYQGRHRLRTIISNAAALSPALKRAAVSYFGEDLLHESYGSTEAGIVTNMRPIELLDKPRSVGNAFANMEIELRRSDGSTTEVGEPGELFARGPYSFNGYLNRADETDASLIDGWVTVGDIAVRDADGAITITDRKKDMVVTGGMNVYPREIESVIEAVPGVIECAVVGLADPEWGETLHAFAVLDSEVKLATDDIIAACRANLAAYKVPKRVSYIDGLPRNPTGKIVKRELRDLAASLAAD